MSRTYTKTERNRYLIGLAGQNIIYGIITSSFAYFLQFTILIPAAWVGIILSISRIFDAVKDPFIGAAINKGRYTFKDYLIALPIPTAVLTVLCFTNGIYASSNGLVKNALIVLWAFFAYLLWEIIFTFGDIPITGYPSILTEVESDKTKLLSLRPIGSMACSIIILLIQPIAFALSKHFGSTQTAERNGFLLTVTVFAIIGGILYQLTALKSEQKLTAVNSTEKNQFKYFFTNPLLKKVCISGILGCFKTMPGIVMTPLITYYFASKNPLLSLFYTFLFGIGSFSGMIISMIFVPNLTQKYTAETIFKSANLLNIVPNILLFLLFLSHPQSMTDIPEIILMFLLSLITGGLTSITSTVQTLLISDAVELEEKLSGNRPTALFFSCQTFIVKIGTGLSSVAVSIGYSIIHFSSEATAVLNEYISCGGIPRLDTEYAALMTMLFLMYTIPPAISSFLSALPFLQKND